MKYSQLVTISVSCVLTFSSAQVFATSPGTLECRVQYRIESGRGSTFVDPKPSCYSAAPTETRTREEPGSRGPPESVFQTSLAITDAILTGDVDYHPPSLLVELKGPNGESASFSSTDFDQETLALELGLTQASLGGKRVKSATLTCRTVDASTTPCR